jgi:TIR domain-containing protein
MLQCRLFSLPFHLFRGCFVSVPYNFDSFLTEGNLKMGHIFISYKNEDRDAAQRVCASLERESITCWMAPRDIPAGREWPTAIVEAIEGCSALVVVLSSNSKNAKQISREAELADKAGVPIFTLRIDDVEPPPGLNYFLSNVQWLDAIGDQFDSGVARLAVMMKTVGGNPPRPETVSAQPAATVQPPSRPAPSVTETVPRVGGDNARRFIAIGGVIAVVLGIVVWILVHRPDNSMTEAKKTADRFLDERDSGNYDAAWGEYTQAFRNKTNREQWQDAETKRRERGQAQHKYNGCTKDSNGYLCDYTLAYPDGHSYENRLSLVRDGSGWAISGGKFKALP